MLRESPPARVMLDNFTPHEVALAVDELQSWGRTAPEVEVSGSITLGNIVSYTIPGVDFISVGTVTSSAPALDVSLVIEEVLSS